MANIELLDKVIEYAFSEGNWDQEEWIGENECGTTYCIAGFTALIFSEGWYQSDVYRPAQLCNINTKEGSSIRDVAVEMLRLSEHDADKLFAPGNDKDDILRVRDEITARTAQ